MLIEPEGRSGGKGFEVITTVYGKGQEKIDKLNQGMQDIIVKKGTQAAEARGVRE